jgi:hypothetical protein
VLAAVRAAVKDHGAIADPAPARPHDVVGAGRGTYDNGGADAAAHGSQLVKAAEVQAGATVQLPGLALGGTESSHRRLRCPVF